MSDTYDDLLDATIQHLENLKSRGVRHVAVAPETLRALAMPAPRLAFADRRLPVEKTATSSAPRTETVFPKSPLPAPIQSQVSTEQPNQSAIGNRQSAITPSLLTPAAPKTDSPPLDPQAKAAAFAELRQRVLACVKCAHLASSRKNVVFGVGNIDAELMFVGEAPGADEDAQGEPFVGRAGELLTKIIQATGLKRSDVYIANILKCRPDTPGQSAGNRKPTPEEMQTCIPFLHEQIDLIRPKILVALGATAVEGLLGKTIGITKLRGQWRTYRGIPLMPTYHPAYLLRNQAMSEKRKVWEDMLAVMEKLGMSISEKQRNYFLNR